MTVADYYRTVSWVALISAAIAIATPVLAQDAGVVGASQQRGTKKTEQERGFSNLGLRFLMR